MEVVEFIFENIVVFQVVSCLYDVSLGAACCYGALKWRRGLMTTVAIGWGIFIGFGLAIPMAFYGNADPSILLVLPAIGMIVLPILTYKIAGVNRFILGYIVSSKLFFMATTVMAKNGDIEILTALLFPLIGGAVIGLVLMAWTQIRVSAFVFGCTFIGASGIAPNISKLINGTLFTATRDISFLFDPIDTFFAFFGVELTDQWTLGAMIVLMVIFGYRQIRTMQRKGIPLDTPLIGFEVPEDKGRNGRVYMDRNSNSDDKNNHIDTM